MCNVSKAQNITVRFSQKSDAEKLLAIYAPYIENTSITFEYEVPSAAEFEKRIETITKQFPYLICEINGEIAGYAYAARFKERAAFQWDAEVSVYLSRKHHRSGIASALYSCLTSLLKKQGYYNLYALITVPNEVSVGFHQACGFRALGTYHNTGYKFGEWHDMIVMEKQLIEFEKSTNPQKAKSIQQLDAEFVSDCLLKCEKMICMKQSKLTKI